MKYVEHYANGGRYEIFRFDSREEMVKTFINAVSRVAGRAYSEYKTNYSGALEFGYSDSGKMKYECPFGTDIEGTLMTCNRTDKETGCVWLFVEVFDSEGYVRTGGYAVAQKLISIQRGTTTPTPEGL